MRARLVLVPMALASTLLAGLVAGCATSTPSTSATTAKPDNGVSALAAADILSKAKAALSAASSFHAKGDMTEEGQTTSIDVIVSGTKGKGTLTTSGVTFELIKIDNDVYLKAPDDYWKTVIPSGQEAALLLFKGKYVKVDATNPQFAGLTTVFDPNEMLKPEGTVSKGEVGTTGGTPTVTLIDDKDGSKLFIATTGEPLPIRIENKTQGAVDFTDFNAATDIQAPSADQVFDLKALMGGS
jgi:hypothetical protein